MLILKNRAGIPIGDRKLEESEGDNSRNLDIKSL